MSIYKVGLSGITVSPSVVLLIVLPTVLLYLLYRLALPRPIPGIPCNRAASKSILGDLPGMMGHISKTGEIWPWVVEQCIKLDSPIIQVFVRPFGGPWVILSDFREAQDILMRRTKEFDRSEIPKVVFGGITPEFLIIFNTKEKQYKEHKHLLQDLMKPDFLRGV